MMTTIEKARELSGFDNSTNVTDAVVNGKIITAESMVNAAIGKRYSLPIKFHRACSITLTGTGSGSGTLTITINGTGYDVSIVSGQTAARTAELFRSSAKNSDDFIVSLSGAVITIISRISTNGMTDIDEADEAIEVSTITPTAGITGTIGVRSDKYPPILSEFAAEIAAALLLKDNYGIEAQDTPKDGDKRLLNIMRQMEQIQNEKGVKLNIYDEVTGLELESAGDTDLAFYPDAVSFASPTESTAPNIRNNQVF